MDGTAILLRSLQDAPNFLGEGRTTVPHRFHYDVAVNVKEPSMTRRHRRPTNLPNFILVVAMLLAVGLVAATVLAPHRIAERVAENSQLLGQPAARASAKLQSPVGRVRNGRERLRGIHVVALVSSTLTLG